LHHASVDSCVTTALAHSYVLRSSLTESSHSHFHSLNNYRYQPLPPIAEIGHTPPFTRIITLAPGIFTDALRCFLTTINIEDAPRYEALSYVWGRSQAESPMWCEGRPIFITVNLDAALRHLRLPTQARRLWVDALCINQENVDERTRQVQYMRLIYKHAARVVVWLGLKSVGVEHALDLARRLSQLQAAAMDEATLEVAMRITLEDSPPTARGYLSEFFDREYFVRSWCVQEVVASAWCIGKCEDLEMDFFDIISAAPYVIQYRGQMFSGKPLEFWNYISLSRQRTTTATASGAVEGSMGRLLTILAGARDFKATDPRDKVFALLGISDEGLDPILSLTQVTGNQNSRKLKLIRGLANGIANRVNTLDPNFDIYRHPTLKPDYKKELVEVYRDLTRFLIRKSPRMLDVLSHVQHTDDPFESSFPSWVPRWFQPRSVSVLGDCGCFSAGLREGHVRYFAVVHDNPLRGAPVEPDLLQLEGFRVDEVRSVSDVMTFDLHDRVPVEAIWKQMFDVSLFPRSNRLYRNKDPLDVAFCMTLIASPLGAVLSAVDLLDIPKMNDDAVPEFVRQAKADIAAYLLSTSNSTSGERHYPDQYATLKRESSGGDAKRFARGARSFSHNRRFYLTQSGYMGVGPMMMRPGDEMCVLFGGKVPFILRPMGDFHVFVGDTYVNDDDIMWGKAIEAVRVGRSHMAVDTFKLR